MLFVKDFLTHLDDVSVHEKYSCKKDKCRVENTILSTKI